MSTAEVQNQHASGTMLHLYYESYARSFPSNARSGELWNAIKHGIAARFERDQSYRTRRDLWEEACVACLQTDGELATVMDKYDELEMAALERESDRKQLPPAPGPEGDAKEYGTKLAGIYKAFHTGKITRREFIAQVKAEAKATGLLTLKAEAAMDKYERVAAESPGGLDGKFLDPVSTVAKNVGKNVTAAVSPERTAE